MVLLKHNLADKVVFLNPTGNIIIQSTDLKYSFEPISDNQMHNMGKLFTISYNFVSRMHFKG